MVRNVAVLGHGAERKALGRDFDRRERKAAHVDDRRGTHDAETHHVDEVRSSRKQNRVLAQRIHRNLLVRSPQVAEGRDVHPVLAFWMAATMFAYAPQRQMLPLIASRTSSSV